MRGALHLILLFVSTLFLACRGAPESAPEQKASPAASPATASTSGGTASIESRRVIRNATLIAEVTDIESARRKTLRLVEERKGYIAGSQSGDSDRDSLQSLELTLRIPSASFEEVLQKLRGLASSIRDERTSSEDVTDTYVDLSARLSAKQKLEERVLALLNDAKSVKDALEIERELATIRTEIEQLEGKKGLLESQTSMATIQVTFQREQARVITSFSAVRDSFDRARADAINTSGMLLTFGIRVAGILLPIALLVGIPALALIWIARKRSRRLAGAAR